MPIFTDEESFYMEQYSQEISTRRDLVYRKDGITER